MVTVPQLKKDFTDTLSGLSRSRHLATVFSDWLEIAACTLHQIPYEAGDFSKEDKAYQEIESKYMRAIQGYDREQLNSMGAMMSMTLLAHRLEFGDFLGEIAAEQELLNQHGGQFFTPYSVCAMMAQMNLAYARKIIEEKGIITISDPAVGGGAQLIASAEALLSQGIDPRSCAQFDAVDVSRNAFNMSYIQLVALDLQAMVRHGNTLSMEMWEHRPTPQLRYFDRDLRHAQAIEAMRQIMVNPESFFQETESPSDSEKVTETAELSGEEGSAINQEEQQSLIDTTTFTGMLDSSNKAQRADVVLPDITQLDLFDRQNNG